MAAGPPPHHVELGLSDEPGLAQAAGPRFVPLPIPDLTVPPIPVTTARVRQPRDQRMDVLIVPAVGYRWRADLLVGLVVNRTVKAIDAKTVPSSMSAAPAHCGFRFQECRRRPTILRRWQCALGR